MFKITAGSTVKYMLLPEILPRIRRLFFDGFALLAYYVALVYGMARLLPRAHPYLNPANIGKYGVRQVVFAAWSNLHFKLKNIDQIVVFFSVLSGLVITLVYIAGAAFFLTTVPAMAAGSYYGFTGDWFTNAYPENDIAFMMLDRMLGIPGIYDSRVVTTTDFGIMPTAFHQGLYALFMYFSWGMFGIAMVLFLYYIVEIVLETTITGTPFGKHFQNAWIPLRIIVGLGLLIPLSSAYGLNSAQWIVLYTAKMGSNFATNGWIAFNRAMENPMGMTNEELVALPVTPDFAGLAKDLFTIRACKDVEQRLASAAYFRSDEFVDPNADTNDNGGEFVATAAPRRTRIDAYFVEGDKYFNVLGRKPLIGKIWPDEYGANFLNLYAEGLRFYSGGDVKIIFGRRVPEESISKWPGGIEPVCGEIVIPNFLPPGQEIPAGDVAAADINEGILIGGSHMFAALQMVYGITKDGWGDSAKGDDGYSEWLMRAATDRYYYQNTAEGQRIIQDRIDGSDPEDTDYNPECPNDSDNDNFDDVVETNGTSQFQVLGDCRGPIENKFFVALIAKYQRFFSFGPIMAYEYYTGKGQEVLDERCTRINTDCGNARPGAAAECFEAKKACAFASARYGDYKPFSSVYYEDLGQDNPFTIKKEIESDIFKYGWGGAGIWYKLISEKNGSLTGSTNNLPRVTHFPWLMEQVSNQRMANDAQVDIGGCDQYDPATAGNAPLSLPGNVNDSREIASMYHGLCRNVQKNEYLKLPFSQTTKTGIPVLDQINAIFGTTQLFNFRENSIVNPMSQLSALGKSLVDKAISNFTVAAGGSAASGLIYILGSTQKNEVGQIMKALGDFGAATAKMAFTIATIALTAGVTLYYVLPLMPFMYFFFAVGTWVKTIFEALVGVPLWALAHVRMDESPGFQGRSASAGYFLLLEIFIRPIVTLFALLASMLIFLALAYILNLTWGLVTSNLVGYDPTLQISNNPLDAAHFRPRVDQLFFTIMYIVIMYLLATSTFKLIDLIPDNVMRWISDVKSVGSQDSSEEIVSGVTSTVAFPTYRAFGSIGGEVVSGVYRVQRSVGDGIGQLIPNPPKPPSGGPG